MEITKDHTVTYKLTWANGHTGLLELDGTTDLIAALKEWQEVEIKEGPRYFKLERVQVVDAEWVWDVYSPRSAFDTAALSRSRD